MARPPDQQRPRIGQQIGLIRRQVRQQLAQRRKAAARDRVAVDGQIDQYTALAAVPAEQRQAVWPGDSVTDGGRIE